MRCHSSNSASDQLSRSTCDLLSFGVDDLVLLHGFCGSRCIRGFRGICGFREIRGVEAFNRDGDASTPELLKPAGY